MVTAEPVLLLLLLLYSKAAIFQFLKGVPHF